MRSQSQKSVESFTPQAVVNGAANKSEMDLLRSCIGGYSCPRSFMVLGDHMQEAVCLLAADPNVDEGMILVRQKYLTEEDRCRVLPVDFEQIRRIIQEDLRVRCLV